MDLGFRVPHLIAKAFNMWVRGPLVSIILMYVEGRHKLGTLPLTLPTKVPNPVRRLSEPTYLSDYEH